MSIFDHVLKIKKKPLPKSERFYEEEEESVIKKYLRFPVFVGLGLVLVAFVIILMFLFNHNNNALAMFNKASSNVFESGSFHYDVCAGVNGTTYMQYKGDMEFDLDKQLMNSSYHAVYEDYEYDAVVYGSGTQSHRGNYYGGKWSVEDYSEKALDFFDFYKDYRKGEFDAGAMLRFTDSSDVFNAQQLKEAFDDIVKEISKPNNMKSMLNQEILVENGVTTVKFTPKLDKVFYLVTTQIGSAFSSADMYSKFLADVENSVQNLSGAKMILSYTINADGYLTEFSFDYTINEKVYFVRAELSQFAKAEVKISDSFFTAANIEE